MHRTLIMSTFLFSIEMECEVDIVNIWKKPSFENSKHEESYTVVDATLKKVYVFIKSHMQGAA